VINFRSPKSAFTLIELLVVVALLGLFAAISLGFIAKGKQKGNDTRRLSDLNQVQKALELYHTNNGKYPTTLDDLKTEGFLSEVPKDPKGAAYKYAALGPSCNDYHLGAILEEVGSKYLATDADLAVSSVVCTGSAPDFAGASLDCTATAGTDQCYDVTLK